MIIPHATVTLNNLERQMLNVSLKKRICRILFGIMTGTLVLLPTVTNASMLTDVLVKGLDTEIIDRSDEDGLTQIQFILSNDDTTGAWLKLTESTVSVDEDFEIIITRIGLELTPISTVHFQVYKLDNNFDAFRPTAADWENHIISSLGPSGPNISSVNLLENNDNSYRFTMNLSPFFSTQGTTTFNLHGDDPTTPFTGLTDDIPWLNFNNGDGGEYLLNIDFNEVDLNLDLTQFPPPASIPLPPAVLMFGSALIGLVSFSRRRGWVVNRNRQ